MREMPPHPRIFKIGATRIIEDATTSGLSAEEVRDRLKVTFPEVTHATIREVTTEDGQTIVHYLPIPGRKG